MVASRFGSQGAKSPAIARLYNRSGSAFARRMAPLIRAFYESTAVGSRTRSLLDVCCGTGQLAGHFLDHGYSVTAIDLSDAMLGQVRENFPEPLATGRLCLVQADAADFHVKGRFGLATSTFDSLNGLQSPEALSSCFRCVFDALEPGGIFVFDLMTRRGFWRDFNSVLVHDMEDVLYVYRVVYDGGEKAMGRMTGFLLEEGGTWERFEEFWSLTLFPPTEVVEALHAAGWTRVWIADADDLASPVDDPDQLDRAFFVATS
jgi:SAM-dependent methyltransferase